MSKYKKKKFSNQLKKERNRVKNWSKKRKKTKNLKERKIKRLKRKKEKEVIVVVNQVAAVE